MTVSVKVRKAVIPAAGLGTRFLPATKAIPKEMIPIIDVPMIQHIVEEAVRSGIEDIVLVTARGKEAIENHFDYHPELENILLERKKEEWVALSRNLAEMCNLICVRQKNPLGLGHAVLTAEPVIGKEPFAVLLGDDLVDAKVPCTQQLIQVFNQHGTSVVGVMEVKPSETKKYGIVEGKKLDPKLTRVSKLIEKPSAGQTQSTLAIPGRYVLDPAIFDCIRNTKPGSGGEIQLTDGLQILAQKKGLMAFEFEGVRYDTGDRLGYLDATLAFALRRPELREGVQALLKKYSEL